MMLGKIVNNLSMKWKILLIVSVPFLGLLHTSGTVILDERKILEASDKVYDLTIVSEKISFLVHELQKERGMSAGFLGSKGKSFAEQIEVQRDLTNQKHKELEETISNIDQSEYGSDFQNLVRNATVLLSNLESWRDKVSSQSVSVKDAVHYYTRTNAGLLNIIGYMTHLSTNSELVNLIAAYFNFLQAKERAGLERAVLSNVFARGHFSGNEFVRFNELMNQQKTYHNLFLTLASADGKKIFKSRMNEAPINEVQRIRNVVLLKEKKMQLISEIELMLGYGGLINHYKDYLIQGNQNQYEKFKKAYTELKEKLSELRQLQGISALEQDAVSTIEDMTNRYNTNIEIIKENFAKRIRSMRNNDLVSVEDFEGILAINFLAKGGNFGIPAESWFEKITQKINILKEIENQLSQEVQTKAQALIKTATAQIWFLTLVFCVLLGLSVFFMVLTINYVLAGLKKIMEASHRMGNGDFSQMIIVDSNDEIGSLSEELNKTQGQLTEMLKDIQKLSNNLSHSSGELKAVSGQLVTGSEEMSEQTTSVSSATEEMSVNISTMAAAAEEMSVNVSTVSSSAEQMSHNMNTIASAIEEMSVSIEEVATNAKNASGVAEEAKSLSRSANEKMDVLNSSAQEIGQVTEMIKKIAQQTNLLALNATIEAASAGDAGKGFAVVAGEIKELANQSAQAAEEITAKITGIQKNSIDTNGVIQGVSDIIGSINESVITITSSVQQQTLAANEISANVSEANKGAGDIASSIAEISNGTIEMSKSAGEGARGASEVASSIQMVNKASNDSGNSARIVSSSADNQNVVAKELQGMVEKFRISG